MGRWQQNIQLQLKIWQLWLYIYSLPILAVVTALCGWATLYLCYRWFQGEITIEDYLFYSAMSGAFTTAVHLLLRPLVPEKFGSLRIIQIVFLVVVWLLWLTLFALWVMFFRTPS